MGLASKLASAQGGAAAVANYGPPAAGAGAQQPGGYPGKPSYQAYGQSYHPLRTYQLMPLASRLAAGGASAPGASAPPYPSSLQPGYPQAQQPSPNAGYQSSAPGGYAQQQYSRPPPPPPSPGQPQSGYPGQAPAYGQQPYNQQPYGQNQGYQQQNQPGSYGYGPPPGPPPPQQQQYGGGPPPQQPPQGQYGAPPQQGQYGGPPPQGQPPQGQYGAPQSGDVAGYQRELEKAVQEKGLQAFYPPGSPRIGQIAARAAPQVDRLCQAWRIQKEIANDIVRLALYDVVIYIDDSGSMSFEENGERIKDLQLILQRVAFAATLFDEDGIELRFMNDETIPLHALSHIKNDGQIEQIMRDKKFKNVTPFGTMLRRKVLDPLIFNTNKFANPQNAKPVLIIGITDGQPAGEDPGESLQKTLQYAHSRINGTPAGNGAIAFQFAQVGNDAKATEFLAKLDNDPQCGSMVDCTSNFENESAEMSKAQPPVDLTPDLWMIKLIMGAIDPSYDTKDEKRAMGGGGQMPPGPQVGGYGGGQQQQYGAPQYGGQQQYGQPQYGGQQGPPPGQYGGQPGQYQQQGPPGGQQYPPAPNYGQQGQQGQYGAGPPRY